MGITLTHQGLHRVHKKGDEVIKKIQKNLGQKKVKKITGDSNFMEEINDYLKNGGRVTRYDTRYADGYGSYRHPVEEEPTLSTANLYTSTPTGKDESSQFNAGGALFFPTRRNSNQK